MPITYSRTPQVVYSDSPVGRTSERSNPGRNYPAHAVPVQYATDAPGPYGGCYKIYEQTWSPNQMPSWGFRHNGQWFKREQRRDFKTNELRWETTGSCNPVAFSS